MGRIKNNSNGRSGLRSTLTPSTPNGVKLKSLINTTGKKIKPKTVLNSTNSSSTPKNSSSSTINSSKNTNSSTVNSSKNSEGSGKINNSSTSSHFNFNKEVNFPYTVRLNGFSSILECVKNGTEAIRDQFLNECNIILECRVCNNLFRSPRDFTCHKFKHCTEKHKLMSPAGLSSLLSLAHSSFAIHSNPPSSKINISSTNNPNLLNSLPTSSSINSNVLNSLPPSSTINSNLVNSSIIPNTFSTPPNNSSQNTTISTIFNSNTSTTTTTSSNNLISSITSSINKITNLASESPKVVRSNISSLVESEGQLSFDVNHILPVLADALRPNSGLSPDKMVRSLDPKELEFLSTPTPLPIRRLVSREAAPSLISSYVEKGGGVLLGPNGKIAFSGREKCIQEIVDKLAAQVEKGESDREKRERHLRCLICRMICPTEKALRIHMRSDHHLKSKSKSPNPDKKSSDSLSSASSTSSSTSFTNESKKCSVLSEIYEGVVSKEDEDEILLKPSVPSMKVHVTKLDLSSLKKYRKSSSPLKQLKISSKFKKISALKTPKINKMRGVQLKSPTKDKAKLKSPKPDGKKSESTGKEQGEIKVINMRKTNNSFNTIFETSDSNLSILSNFQKNETLLTPSTSKSLNFSQKTGHKNDKNYACVRCSCVFKSDREMSFHLPVCSPSPPPIKKIRQNLGNNLNVARKDYSRTKNGIFLDNNENEEEVPVLNRKNNTKTPDILLNDTGSRNSSDILEVNITTSAKDPKSKGESEVKKTEGGGSKVISTEFSTS